MGKNIITKTLTGSGSFTVPSGVTQISVSPGLTRSAFIAGGAMAIAPSGQAYAWGQNSWGQIGDGTIVPKSSPVATVAGYSFLKISAVGSYFLGLLPSGQVYGWGQNTTGQLGDG
ncbi:cell wall anchor protein, partial [bacterium]|nr:cell wall anchor protein [bacterium]